MTRKPLDQNEFLSALDFVKTDIDNLRAYFEQGAIVSTPAVMERALKLRVSIEMFVALFKTDMNGGLSFSNVLEDLTIQSKILTKQNAEVLEELKRGKEPIQATILNEVLNVKEMLLKQSLASENSPAESEIAKLKVQLSSSLAELEHRIMKNVEYSQREQLREYSQTVLSELAFMKKPSHQGSVVGEILGEIAEFREECAKQIAGVEKNIIDNIESSKEEIICSQKSDEILKVVKDGSADLNQSIVLAKTSMQVLRGISKQLLGVYEAQKRSLASIEKSIAGVTYNNHIVSGEDVQLAQGFAELKEELQSISNIINFDEIEKIKDTNQAIQLVDNYTNAQFEPEGLLQTAKELEALATELSELEKSQAEIVGEASKTETLETSETSEVQKVEETDEAGVVQKAEETGEAGEIEVLDEISALEEEDLESEQSVFDEEFDELDDLDEFEEETEELETLDGAAELEKSQDDESLDEFDDEDEEEEEL